MNRLFSLKMFPLVLSLLVAPLNLIAQTPQQNDAARALFLDGRNLWDDGQFAAAESKFREALTKYPRADKSDRTAFYLITTLIKLGKTPQARAEIDAFNRKYPQSSWASDVEEKRLSLVGIISPAPVQGRYLRFPVPQPVVPSPAVVLPAAPFRDKLILEPNSNVALQQEVLSQIVAKDPNFGIEIARTRIKGNPSDPAVISTLPVIAGSGSPQAIPFLFFLAGNDSSSPNTRSQAVFWIARSSDKDGVGKAVVDLMQQKDSVTLVTDVLNRFSPVEQRNVIDQIAQRAVQERLPVLENIYRNNANQALKTQIVHSVGSIREPAALHFLTDVARNERLISVRRAAIQSLASRDDTALTTLDMILKTLNSEPAKAR